MNLGHHILLDGCQWQPYVLNRDIRDLVEYAMRISDVRTIDIVSPGSREFVLRLQKESVT